MSKKLFDLFLLLGMILVIWGILVERGHCEEGRWKTYYYYGTLHAADFASTEIALSRGNTHEANPLPGMQSIGWRAVFTMAGAVGSSEFDRVLVRRKKRKTVWVMRGVFFFVKGYAVQHNLRVGR